MRLRTPLALLGAALLVLVGPPLLTTGSGAGSGTHIPGLRLMVPNSPGGGYDITARTAAKNAEDAGLTRSVEVFNLPGARRHGRPQPPGERARQRQAGDVDGARRRRRRPLQPRAAHLADTTPIARLTEEQDVVVVAKDSPYRTVDDLVKAWKAAPGRLPVGGGSSPAARTTSRRC